MPNHQKVIFSLDAETIGLYGEPFAIAYTLIDLHGKELESAYLACPSEKAQGSDENRAWIKVNALPHLPTDVKYDHPMALCEAFYQIWLRVKENYPQVIPIADCLYPVEALLFSRMIQTDELRRQWTGPYPLHELSTALLIAGIKKTDHPRLSKELPEHHPLNDARYAARLFLLAWSRSKH